MLQTLISRSAIAAILLTASCAVAFGAEDRTISVDGESTVSAKPDMANGHCHGNFDGVNRVATLDQKPELQLDALKAAGCKKVFVEKVSSAKEVRPQLAAALAYLREGDMLVVWKLDRLARSMKQLIETVDLLKARGIGFRSLTEAIDTTSAAGELFFHIFGALAQFERSIIRERTNAGIKAALARGRKGGRPQKFKSSEIVGNSAFLSGEGAG